MKCKMLIFLFAVIAFPFTSMAQTDVFPGSWHMEYRPVENENSYISLDLEIGTAEQNLLYPAELTIKYDSFSATYHLLLVKRNIRQLAIGRNKVATAETTFSIGNWTILLNGLFDYSRDKGIATLTAERMYAKQYGILMPEERQFALSQQPTATVLRNFFKDAEIKLKKANNTPLENSYVDSILKPGLSAGYYGIIDTIKVNDRNGVINFTGNKKSSGVVSVVLNGNAIIDQNDLGARKPSEEIRLDTGLNILVFFADNYGKTPANTGVLHADFGDKKFSMDFSNQKDLAATFIVAKIYYAPEIEKEKEDNSPLSNSILRELSEADLQKDIKNYHYPDTEGKNLLKEDNARAKAETALLRSSKPVGNIKANARKIILALWDDAVEDGDTISLNINGHWVVQAFPVKKKPQFIEVILDPGPNKIIFIADNLGAIIPNTAILEIIDGRQRRSFMIDTDLGHNNLISILYELRPD